MLKFKFVVDEDIIARYLINTSTNRNNISVALANELWKRHTEEYRAIQKDPFAKADNLLAEIKSMPFFQDYVQTAKENKVRIENNFAKKQGEIEKVLYSLTKTDIDMPEQTVYVMPPRLCVGMNIGNNKILWGHRFGLQDENYDLVYLCHEGLHSVFDRDNMSHAIIEYLADIELARHFTGKPYRCHDYTLADRITTFPYWNLYLNRSPLEIEKAKRDVKINYSPARYEKDRETFSKMNIFDFVYCMKQANHVDYDTEYQIKE